MSAGALPLTVVALGGNAISPPRGDLSLAAEREGIARATSELAALATLGARLLVIHGNGPQVGRLLAAPGLGDPDSLDVHVAQTQGELGYLLAEALDRSLQQRACVALVTRVLVDPDDPALGHPSKPVGATLPRPPSGVPSARVPGTGGWRRVVASPRPLAVVELSPLADLLASRHVIAAGGGGVVLAGLGPAQRPCPAVVDKDWVAALLAVQLDAARLVFVTDVPHAFERFGTGAQQAIRAMRVAEAEARLAAGDFAAGSMAPKVESAARYARATGRPAVIAGLGSVSAALAGRTGTRIES